jgi:hypothetical protein
MNDMTDVFYVMYIVVSGETAMCDLTSDHAGLDCQMMSSVQSKSGNKYVIEIIILVMFAVLSDCNIKITFN